MFKWQSCFVLMLACATAGAAEDNPLKNASVGDWVTYKLKGKMGGKEITGDIKKTVKSKTDTEVVLTESFSMNGGKEKTRDVTYKLADRFNPLLENPSAKEVASGEEKLTVGDKTYDTKWTEVTNEMGAMKSKGKVWMSNDVKVGGLLKFEIDSGALGSQAVELTGQGSAAK
jgi:hypothetical protein